MTEVSEVELARIGAVADVSATLDNVAEGLRETIEQQGDDAAAPEGEAVDLGTLETMLAATEAHEGWLPIELWIDGEQRIWRISYDLAGWTQPSTDDAGQPSTFALDLRGFGSADEISIPDADDIVDVDDPDDDDLPVEMP